jgi:hypothetical protein
MRSGLWLCHEREKSTHASEQHRPEVTLQRAGFAIAQTLIDPDDVVVDETGLNMSIACTHGRPR